MRGGSTRADAVTADWEPSRRAEAPLYLQLRDDLRRMIAVGQFKDGDAIPPEPVLCETYGVSRITVRRAVAELAAEGLVEKVPGKGTFVRGAPFSPSLVSLTGFGSADEVFEVEPRRTVLRKWEESADSQIAGRLGLAEGAPVVGLERLLQDGERVLAIDTTRYSGELLPGFLAHVGNDVSTLQVIKEIYALEASGASGVLGVASAGVEQAAHLGCSPNDPLLTVDKVIYSAGRVVLVHSVLWVNPRRVSMHFEVS